MSAEPTHTADTLDLAAWLPTAHERHAQAPAVVAAELLARAPTLQADAPSGEALRLAEHLWLAHLGDVAGLQAFLTHVPPGLREAEATAPSLQRAQWAAATLSGQVLPAADQPTQVRRWAALQNLVLALARQGRADAAWGLLQADEAAALAEGPSPAGKAFAASANNVAGHLQDGPREPARDALMLQAAALARRAWAQAGDWMSVERADYRLALCHAAVGQGEVALSHARQCLAACEAQGADAMERFFAHEALAHAQHARGDGAALATEKARMAMLLAEVPEDDGLRAWCADTLRALPASA